MYIDYFEHIPSPDWLNTGNEYIHFGKIILWVFYKYIINDDANIHYAIGCLSHAE